MRKGLLLFIMTTIMLLGAVVPCFALPTMPTINKPYWVMIHVSSGGENGYRIYATDKPLRYEYVGSNRIVANESTQGEYTTNASGSWVPWFNQYTYSSGELVISYGTTTHIESANYSIGSYTHESISMEWGVDAGFDARASYDRFRSYALHLTVNTVGFPDLTYKQYVQRETSNGWLTLNVESPITIRANLGIGKDNTIPLWSIIPYTAGRYRMIVNAYNNGIIVQNGSTTKTFDLINASAATTTTTGSSIQLPEELGGNTITPVSGRRAQILTPAEESEQTGSYFMRCGIYDVTNGKINVEGLSQSSVVYWTVNPDDPSDYLGYTYQLAGMEGDSEISSRFDLPKGYGTFYGILTGGTSSSVETDFFAVELDGKWWHSIDYVTINTTPTVDSGRGSDYHWDDSIPRNNGITDAWDLQNITESITNYVGQFGTFFSMMQATMLFIPTPLMALVLFGATMSLVLVIFRR